MQEELACRRRIHFGRSYQNGGSNWELAMWPHLTIYCITRPLFYWQQQGRNINNMLILFKGEIHERIDSHVSHEVRKDRYKWWWWLNWQRSHFLNKGLLIKFVELLRCTYYIHVLQGQPYIKRGFTFHHMCKNCFRKREDDSEYWDIVSLDF